MSDHVTPPADPPDLVRARFQRMDPADVELTFLLGWLMVMATDHVDRALTALEAHRKEMIR